MTSEERENDSTPSVDPTEVINELNDSVSSRMHGLSVMRSLGGHGGDEAIEDLLEELIDVIAQASILYIGIRSIQTKGADDAPQDT